MLSFIKKLFTAEEKREDLLLGIFDLAKRLEEKEAQIAQGLSSLLRDFDSRAEDIRDELSQAIDTLEKAELQNPNMPARALQFMTGNRESYIRLSRQFLRDALHAKTEGMDYAALKGHFAHIRSSLEHFLAQSQRNYAVLQQFFAHESRAVAKSMKDMEVAMRELELELGRIGFESVLLAKSAMRELRGKKEALEEISEKKKQLEHSIAHAQERVALAKNSIDEFLKHANYAAYLKLQEALSFLEMEEKKLSQKLSHYVLMFDKPLRKFAKVAIEHEELAKEYAEDAFLALKKDTKLALHDILLSLDKTLQGDGFGLDEKRVLKAREAIFALDKEKIRALQEEAVGIEKRKAEIRQEIANLRIAEEKKELEEALERITNEKDSLQKSLLALREQARSIDLAPLLRKIEEKSSEVLKASIRIDEGAREEEEDDSKEGKTPQ